MPMLGTRKGYMLSTLIRLYRYIAETLYSIKIENKIFKFKIKIESTNAETPALYYL